MNRPDSDTRGREEWASAPGELTVEPRDGGEKGRLKGMCREKNLKGGIIWVLLSRASGSSYISKKILFIWMSSPQFLANEKHSAQHSSADPPVASVRRWSSAAVSPPGERAVPRS